MSDPSRKGSTLRRASEFKPQTVKWLWDGFLPAGKVTLLDGDPGLGKSTLTADLAARVSAGGPMPGSAKKRLPRNVLLLSAEDAPGDTILPRLKAHGAKTGRVHLATWDADPLVLTRDSSSLRLEIETHRPALVVIDPFMSFLDGGIDYNKDNDVRAVLRALSRIAEEHATAILLVRHLNKRQGGSAMYRGGGSIGMIAGARVGLLVAADPKDPDARVLAVLKSNLAARPTSRGFGIVESREWSCGQIDWRGESVLTAEELLDTHDQSTTVDRARDFLRSALVTGPKSREQLRREAEMDGHSWRAIERARAELDIRTQQIPAAGKRGAGPSWWSLGDTSDEWSAKSMESGLADHSDKENHKAMDKRGTGRVRRLKRSGSRSATADDRR